MTIADLICYLRQKLLIARNDKNTEDLKNLWDAINLMLESAYECGDRDVGALLEAMGDSIRDSLMGVEWKSEIPSVETINVLDKNK
jgi:hypothetical protein